MNIVPLRRAILKELAIFSVILGLLGGGVWYLGSVHGDFMNQKDTAIRTANKLQAEKLAIETKFSAIKENMGTFEESQRWIASPGLYIDSQAVRDLFNYYQSILFLKKMSVEMQPVVNLTDAKYVRQHFVATKTNARVVIEATTDEDIYGLIQVMQSELPGFLKITSISTTKTKELSKEILAQIRKEGSHTLVTSEIGFDWYGLKSNDSSGTFNKYVPIKREGQAK